VRRSQSVVTSEWTTSEEHEKQFDGSFDGDGPRDRMNCVYYGTEGFRTIDMEGPAELTVLSEIPLCADDEHGPRNRMTCKEYETEFDQNPNGEGPGDFTDIMENLEHLQHLSFVFRCSRFRTAMPQVKQSQRFAGRGRVSSQIIPKWPTVVPCQVVEVHAIRTELATIHASAAESHCCRGPKSIPSDPCQATTLSLPACSQEPGMKDVSAMVGVGNQLAASGVAKSSLACQRIFEKNQASNTSHNQDVCTPTPSGSDVPSTATV